jgi:hypothetical protein
MWLRNASRSYYKNLKIGQGTHDTYKKGNKAKEV